MTISLERLKRNFDKKFDIKNYDKVYIIGSGLSLKNVKLGKITNNPRNFIIAVKYTIFYKKVNADIFFSSDENFIEKIYYNNPGKYPLNKIKKNKNLMSILLPNDNSSEKKYPNHIFKINHKSNYKIDSLLQLKKRVPCNHLSGNRAIYLAIYLGFKDINLCGFDSINPNIKNPDIKDVKILHCDDYHKHKRNHNDVLLKNELEGSNIKKFFNLINNQKKNKKDKIIINFIDK